MAETVRNPYLRGNIDVTDCMNPYFTFYIHFPRANPLSPPPPSPPQSRDKVAAHQEYTAGLLAAKKERLREQFAFEEAVYDDELRSMGLARIKT